VRKHVIYARRVYVLVLHQSREKTIIQPIKTTITILRNISLRLYIPIVVIVVKVIEVVIEIRIKVEVEVGVKLIKVVLVID
jgi:hypothetical protein